MVNELQKPLYGCAIGALVGALIFGGITVWALISIPDLRIIYSLVCVVGWASGWFSGLMFVPFTFQEQKKASDTYKALAAFASGYLVSKIEPFITAGIDGEHIQASFTGLMFFISSFLTTFVLVIIYRLYVELPIMRSFSHTDESVVSNSITEEILGKD